MNSAIYVRTSWDETDNPRESIKTQEASCRKRSEENQDTIIKVYSDIGKSGGSIKRRKQFIQMKQDALNKIFSRVYILNLSRFSRRLIDQENSIVELQRTGVDIYSVEDGLLEDKTTFIRQVKGAYNQEQLRIMAVQTEIEHSTRLDKCLPVSRPPLGYKTNKKTKKWDVDEKKANIVRQVFDMKANGKALKEISQETKIIIPTLKHMLSNLSYLGIYQYKEKSFNAHEPIIIKEVFDKCQI